MNLVIVNLVEKRLSDHFVLLVKECERPARERELLKSGLTSLILALEARDSYTCGHSEAVVRWMFFKMAESGLSQRGKVWYFRMSTAGSQ